jgi:hypothetical protein
MDLTYEQLVLTNVNEAMTIDEQHKQWQMELDNWFKGLETIKDGNNYFVEERVLQLPKTVFNKMFGTNLDY